MKTLKKLTAIIAVAFSFAAFNSCNSTVPELNKWPFEPYFDCSENVYLYEDPYNNKYEYEGRSNIEVRISYKKGDPEPKLSFEAIGFNVDDIKWTLTHTNEYIDKMCDCTVVHLRLQGTITYSGLSHFTEINKIKLTTDFGNGTTISDETNVIVGYMINPFDENGQLTGLTYAGHQMVNINGEIRYIYTYDYKIESTVGGKIEILNEEAKKWFILTEGTNLVTIHPNDSYAKRTAKLRITDTHGGHIVYEGEYTQEKDIDSPEDIEFREKKAMMALYKSFNTPRAKQEEELMGKPLSEWGIDWNLDSNGHVKQIEFYDVEGSLPEEIGDLKFCKAFAIVGNVYGTIPQRLAEMKSLKKLEIANAKDTPFDKRLEGRLEDTPIKDIASQLTFLRISNNNFTGPVPEWIGDISENGGFWIDGNRLEGKVPDKVQAHPWWNKPDLTGTEGIETYGDFQMIQQEGYILYK